MCGRYALHHNLGQILALFRASTRLGGLTPTYNAAPEGNCPILIKDRLGMAAWGWPGPDGTARIINIRNETMHDKRMFAPSARAGRRCIIPASGFYEWDASGQPFYVTAPDDALIGLCGLWTRNEAQQPCFGILTRAALPHLAPIHPRMPVTLLPDEAPSWLGDGQLPEPPVLTPRPVGKGVNDTANDSPALLDPMAAAPQGNLFATA